MADFHILALSGGGFRGLYTATVLKHLEESLGAPLANRFDLTCGTSAGGLLALGVASGMRASELQALFECDGRRIFGARSIVRRVLSKFIVAKHSSTGLRAVLEERFKEKTLGDLQHRVLIPTVNYSTGKGQFFKTPHTPAFEMDHRQRLVDVAMATSAAPTYFPLHRIQNEGVFADGGLVGNSPGFFGLHEARQVLQIPATTTIRLLAIGTMTLGATLRGSAFLDRGIALWGSKVFDLVISAQENAVDSMLRHILNTNYVRIDDLATPDQSKDIASLDHVSPGAIDVLVSRGTQAARRALGDPAFAPFRSHLAERPTFFHGPNRAV
ncbi:MAG: CBASS cGAMP-activated phospholipase [Gammaproteobacteria bacterium]